MRKDMQRIGNKVLAVVIVVALVLWIMKVLGELVVKHVL